MDCPFESTQDLALDRYVRYPSCCKW